MDLLHPEMQKAMRSRVPAGFSAAPVMHSVQHLQARIDVLSAALLKFNAPPCPTEHFSTTYQHPELGELECHLCGELAEAEHGWPGLIELRAAYLCGREISDRLSNKEVERIEIAARSRQEH